MRAEAQLVHPVDRVAQIVKVHGHGVDIKGVSLQKSIAALSTMHPRRTMAHKTSSDFTPFLYEPLRRADRIATRSEAPQNAALKPAEAMRLLRSSRNPRDRALTPLAEAWRDRLSQRLPTRTLCEHYPRIANRLALCWSDRMLTRQLLDQLLHDRRGGRKGFPAPVRAELVALSAAVGSGLGA